MKAKINPRSREGGLRHGIHLSRCSTSPASASQQLKPRCRTSRSSNLAQSPGRTFRSPSDCQPFDCEPVRFLRQEGPWPSSDSQGEPTSPFYLRPPDSVVHLGAITPDVIKTKALTDTGSEVGPPLSLLASSENVALGSSEERTKRRTNTSLAPHPRISLKLRLSYWNRGGVGPSRALVPVFGHAEWALESSGLRTERRRGWGILSSAKSLVHFLDPHNCWSQRAREESSHFKLHFSLRWWFSSISYTEIGRGFSLRILRIHSFTFSTKKNKLILLDFRKRHHQPGLRITQGNWRQ